MLLTIFFINLNDVLTGVFRSEQNSAEVVSTEDMLACVECMNDKIRKGEIKPKSLMVGSLDVAALYPSIDV